MRGALVVDPEMFLLNEEGWGGGEGLLVQRED